VLKRTDEKVTHDHGVFLARANDLLAFYRQRLLIPLRWNIEIIALCPDEIDKRSPDHDSVQGSMSWDYWMHADFRMRLRCTLDQELEWVIAHELLEAVLGRFGDFMDRLILAQRSNALRHELFHQNHELRDEVIEWFLDILLADTRPTPRQAI